MNDEKQLTEEIRKIEKIVDVYHLSLAYLNKPFQQAVFDILRVSEHLIQNIDYSYALQGAIPAYDAEKFAVLDALNMGLHWIYQKHVKDKNDDNDKNLSFNLSKYEYQNTLDFLLKYCLRYSQVCDAYISYSRGRFVLEKIEDKNVSFTVPDNQESAFKAEMSNFFDNRILLDQYDNKIQQVINANKNELNKAKSLIRTATNIYSDETIIKAFLNIADVHWYATSLLPRDWQFDDFSLEEYRLCWRELFAIAFLHMAGKKSGNVYEQNVIVQKKEDLIHYLLKRTNLNENTVNNVIDMIIFNPSLRHSNIIHQPLISIGDSLLITPSLFINFNTPEGNLIALIQKLNNDSKHFSAVNKLEEIMKSQIEEHISKEKHVKLCQNIDLKIGSQITTDVDFGILDMKSKSALICELKWLLEAEATADVYAREDDVDHGCRQIEKAMGYVMCNKTDFIKQAFNVDVDEQIDISCCVITKANVRNNDRYVPVINQQKFIELLKNQTSYADMFDKIRRKDYQNPISKDIKIEYLTLAYAGYLFHVPVAAIDSSANFKSF